jgi:protease-4
VAARLSIFTRELKDHIRRTDTAVMKRKALLRILILCAIGLAVIVYSLRGHSGVAVEDGSTVVLVLEGGYVEGPAAPLLAKLMGNARSPFVGLLGSFALLERDDRVENVVLHVKSLEIGWAKAQEIRRAIGRLRAAGRKTVAFLELSSFSPNLEYFVASAADEIYLPPGSALPMLGLASEHFYLGGLFEKLGIDIEVAKVGKFKSAAESFAEKEMSEPARFQANALLDSTFDYFVAGIAEGRGLAEEAVRDTIDAGLTRPDELAAAGFIDGESHLAALTDRLGGPVVSHTDYLGVSAEDVGFDPVAEFALVYGTGNVVSGEGSTSRSGEPIFASETVSKALVEAAEDPRFSAVILRIDSPGGSALASEMIWNALQRARETGKPVIASFSDVAASGGYYVGAGADAIVAPALSITGSIGVFALRPVVGDLLDEVGIGIVPFTRGKHADFYLSAQPLSEGASARLQGLVEETYELFVERVSAGRGMSTQEVHEVAQGRVWTGAQAYEVGLVDELGGLRTALNRARADAGLSEDDDVALVPYPPTPTLSDQLLELVGVGVSAWSASSDLSALSALLLPLSVAADSGTPAARALRELRSFVTALPLGQPLALAPALPVIR